MNLYLIVILAYSLVLAGLGLESLRRTRQASDFLVAGRGLSGKALFVSLLAANIGAGSTVGATGLGYKVGLSAWWWVGSAGIGSLLLGLTVGPKIWKLAHQHHFYTVGDFLQYRFGTVARYQVASVIWACSLVILASQLIAVAWILNVVAGVSKPVGCLIGGALATLYFTAGGLKGTIRINAIQLSVKLGGFLLALWFAWHALGSMEPILARLNQTFSSGAKGQDFLNPFGNGPADVVGYLVVLVPAFIVSPGLLQKIYGARDENAVRAGVLGNALVLLLYAIVPVLLGMLARAQHPGLPNHEMALPVMMVEVLPAWLGALALAAVFSAEVGTVDAVLLMLSSSLVQDFYRPFFRPQADDAHLLRVSRVIALVAGGLGILLALQLSSIIQGLTIFYSLITAAVTIPLIAGLYLPQTREKETTLAGFLSMGVMILVFVSTSGKGWGGLPPVLIGGLAGFGFLIVWLLTQKKKNPAE